MAKCTKCNAELGVVDKKVTGFDTGDVYVTPCSNCICEPNDCKTHGEFDSYGVHVVCNRCGTVLRAKNGRRKFYGLTLINFTADASPCPICSIDFGGNI
jgi:hypothetical protein